MSPSDGWRSHAVDLACTRCERPFAMDEPHNLCPCGAPLSCRYDLETVRRVLSPQQLAMRPPGLWRYREILPVQDRSQHVSLGEGGTPLLALPRLATRLDWGGAPAPQLLLKDESFNPTNSFKARGMAVAVSRARELGLRHLAVPSAGNAGTALAAYAARAGLRATIFMPRDTETLFVDECVALGADVELVDGLIDACGKRVAAGTANPGWFDMSTLKEPYRLEGKKTLGYELAEQLHWRLPDWIVYPTGGGTGLIGMWKAFQEMLALGWVEPPLPRLLSVQAAGCAPIVRAFHSGALQATAWETAQTFALGLRVPVAVADFLMLRALRQSQGTAVAVGDADIAAAGKELARTEGIFASPEGAATWAALRQLVRTTGAGGARTIVLFNTGGWYKYASGWRAALGYV